MILHAWRLVKARHAACAFTGEGAKRFGGRWNSAGVAVVYAAQSVSLAMLESLVHLQSDELLRRYVLFELSFDAALVSVVDTAKLPRNWRQFPPPVAVQRLGDAWIAAAKTPIFRVPSVLVSGEHNYLLNPVHPDFSRIAIGLRQPVRFDPRLIKSPPR